jgi:hypothetical protein
MFERPFGGLDRLPQNQAFQSFNDLFLDLAVISHSCDPLEAPDYF